MLVKASADGGTIVVGNRGRGDFASLVLGSVSQQVALHAQGPVVVVRGRSDHHTGPVVVGVDGSPDSQQALRLAFEEAMMWGTRVSAVRAYSPIEPSYAPDVPGFVEDPGKRHEAEMTALAADVASWAKKYPDVDISCSAIAGGAGQVLTDQSATARLVVVGNRGHGGFTGLLLGSVGLHLLHHAGCPVLVARGVNG
jgi:nucleotide-binding universal stress UspA family protein